MAHKHTQLAIHSARRQFSPSLHIAVAGAIVDEWFPEWNSKASLLVDHHLHAADKAMEGHP